MSKQTRSVSNRFNCFLLILCALIAFQSKSAFAATVTWTAGSGTDLNWDTAANWNTNAVPTFADDVLFPTPIPNPGALANPNVIALGASDAAQSLTLRDAYNLSGTNGALTLFAVAGNVTVAPGITATLTAQLNGGDGLTLPTANGLTTNAGADAQAGGGTLTLASTANSYTGVTTINLGVLAFSNVAQLNSSSSIAILGQSNTAQATLSYTGGSATLTRAIALGTVASTVASPNVINVSTPGTILIATGNVTGGPASGASNQGLMITGGGILSLENPTHTNNSFTGDVVINGGNVRVIGDNNAAAGDPFLLGSNAATKNIILQGGGSLISQTTPIDFTSTLTKVVVIGTGGGTLNCGSNMVFNDPSQLTGSGTVTFKGAGSAILNGTAQPFTGSIVVDGGTVSFQGSGVADPLFLGAGVKNVTVQNGGKLQPTTNADFNAGTKSLIIGTGGGTIDTPTGVTLVLNDAGQLSGTGTLTKTSAGTLVVGQQSTGYGGATGYTGGQVNLNGGVISLDNPQGFGGGAGGTVAAITMAAGTTLNLFNDGAGSNSTIAYGNNISLTGSAVINVDRNTANTGNTIAIGTLTVPASATLTVTGGDGYGLGATGAAALGAGSAVTSSVPLTFSAAVTLGSSLSLTNTASTIFNGDLSGTASGFTLTKSGAGGLYFNGAQVAANPVNLNVAAGTLGGNGTLNGSVTVGAGVPITPGDIVSTATAAGTLTTNGGITTASSDTFTYQLGTTSDLINAGSSNVTVAGVVNVQAATGFVAGNTYHLLQTTGTITNSLAVGSLPASTAGRIVLTAGSPNTLDLVTSSTTTYTWTGAANDGGHWSTGNNWQAGTAPPVAPNSVSAALLFPAGLPLTLINDYATDTTFFSLTFADNYTLTGNRLQLTATGTTLAVTAGRPVLNVDLLIGNSGATMSLAASTSLTLGTSANTITNQGQNGAGLTLVGATGSTCTINSVISGTGSLVTLTGGTVTLAAGNSSYTGLTSIGLGSTLAVGTLANGGSNSSIGSSTNAAANLVLAGGTLRYTGPAQSTDRLFTIGLGGGTLDASGSGSLSFTNTGSIAVTDTTLGRTGNIVNTQVSGGATYIRITNLSTTSDLVPGTASTVIATGLPANSIIAVILDANSIQLASSTTATTGTGVALQFAITNRALTLTGTGTASLAAIVPNGAGSNLVSMTKSGAGTWTLSGASTLSGTTKINSGVLKLASTAATLANSTVAVSTSNGLAFNGTTGGTYVVGNLASGVDSVTFAPISLPLTDAGNSAVTLQAGGNNSNATFNGTLTGTGALLKTGSGLLSLSNANTYSGLTTINAGTLGLGNSTAYRYYKFNVTACAAGGNGLIQIDDFQVFANSVQLTIPLATSSAPTDGGDPLNEQAIYTTDNLVTTKWLHNSLSALTLDMGIPTAIDKYQYVTGNDTPGRDPVSWTWAGSNDNVNFTTLDTQSNLTITQTRNVVGFTSTYAPPVVSNRLPSTATVVFGGTSTLDVGNTNQTLAGVTINDVASLTATLRSATTSNPLVTPLITFAGTFGSSVTATATPSTLTGGTISIGGGVIDASAFGVTSGTNYSATKVLASNLVGTGGITVKSFGDISDTGGGGAQRFSLTGTSTFTGNLTVASGMLVYASASDAGYGNASNSVLIQPGAGLLCPATTTMPAARTIVLNGPGEHYFRIYGSQTFTLQGAISGIGNLRTTDGGTLVMGAPSTYTGTTTIASTTSLTAGVANAFSSTSQVIFTAGGTLNTNGFTVGVGSLSSTGTNGIVSIGTGTLSVGGDNLTASYGGTLTGTGVLNKVGLGIQTVTNAALAFSGPVNVNGGTLLVDGTFTGAGAVTVASGGTLGGKGTVAGNVTVNGGGALSPGDPGVPNKLTLSSGTTPLTLNANAILNINLTVPQAPALTFTAGDAFIQTGAGTVALGANNVQLNVLGTVAAGNTYRILSGAASVTGTITRVSAPSGFIATATATSGTFLDVSIVATTAAQTFTWSGAGADSKWQTPLNWVGGSKPSGNSGETLVFPATGVSNFTPDDDFPSGTSFAAIQITSTTTPYVITSSGGFSIVLGSSNALTSSATTSNSFNIDTTTNASTIVVTAGSLSVGTGSNLLKNNGTTLALNPTGTLTINSIVSGTGAVSQTAGAGTTSLTGGNTFSGGLTLGSGFVAINSDAALGAVPQEPSASVTFSGAGILQASTTPITLSATRTIVLNAGISGTINTPSSNVLTINGSVQGATVNNSLLKIGSGTLVLTGVYDDTNLTLRVAGGTVNLDKSIAGSRAVAGISGIDTGATVKLTGTSSDQILGSTNIASYAGVVNITGGTLDLNGHTESWDRLTGVGTVTNSNALAAVMILGESNSSCAFTGVIQNGTGTTALSKIGTGTVSLVGNNTYSGGTTVSAGVLGVSKSGPAVTPLGSGTVTLAGGTLSLRGNQVQLATTGWNADVIRGAFEASASAGTTNDVDGGGFVFYEHGTPGATQQGLPVGGSVTNIVNGVIYQLQPYTAVNDLRIAASSTAALTLTTPGSFSALHFAHVGGSGAPSYSFTLNFAGGTSTTVTGVTAPDWFNNTPFIDSDFGREVRSTGAYDTQSGNPRLYDFTYTLSAADAAKTLNSISFTTNANGGAVLNIFAVTGDSFSAPQSYANNIVVTANSTLDVLNSMNASIGTITVGANTLSVTSGAATNVAYSLTTGAVTLTGSPTISVANNGTGLGTATFGTVGSSANAITKSGAGTLVLTGANAYGGGTTISAGTLQIGDGVNAANDASVLGDVTDNGALVFANVNNSSYTGVISGTGSLTKTAAGTLTLTGASTYNGATTVSGGTLNLSNQNALQNSTLTMNGGSLTFDSSVAAKAFNLGGLAGVSFGSGYDFALQNTASAAIALTVGSNAASTSYAGTLSGGGSLTKTGAGTLTLNTLQTYTGATLISGGTLKISGVPNSPVANTLLYQLDASKSSNYSLTGGNVTQWTDLSGNSNNFVNASSTVAVLNGGSAFLNRNVLNFNFSSTASLTLGNSTSPLTVFILEKVNASHTGDDQMFGRAGNDNNIRIASATSIYNPGNANDFTNGTGGSMYVNGVLQAGNATAGTAQLLEAYAGANNGFPWAQTSLSNNSSNRFFDGYMGEVVAYGTALSAADRQSVEAYLMFKWFGTLPPGFTPIGKVLPASSSVTVSNGATLDTTAQPQTVAALTSTDGLGSKVVAGSGTLTVGGATNTTFDGVISGTGGTVTKQGSGTLTMTGVNTYTGATILKNGALSIGATGSLASASAVTITGNGVSTLASAQTQLRGTGTVGGTVTAAGTVSLNDAVLWPGTFNTPQTLNTNETLTVNNTVDLSTNGKLAVVFNNAGSVQRLSTTTLALGGNSALSLSFDAVASGKTYTIVNASSGIAVPFTTVLGISGYNADGATHPASADIVYSNGTTTFINPTSATTLNLTGATTIKVVFNSGVTPVKLDAFTAQTEGAGVLLSWNSVSEYQNAGYNVYRRSIDGSAWTRVNASLIQGLITNADGKTYRFYDWADQGVYEYRLESVSIWGDAEDYSRLAGPVSVDSISAADFAASESGIDAALHKIRNDIGALRAIEASAKFAGMPDAVNANGEALNLNDAALAQAGVGNAPTALARNAQGRMILPGTAEEANTRPSAADAGAPDAEGNGVNGNAIHPSVNPIAASRWFTQSTIATSSSKVAAVKVQYVAPGIMAIPQSSLPAGFNVNHVAVQREGRGMTALAVLNNTLYLYGQGYNDEYTNKDAIFLRSIPGATAASNVTAATGLFGSPLQASVTTPASVTASYHDVYFDYNYGYRPFTFTPWFSSQYLTDGSDQNFSLTTPNAGSGPATMTVNLWSLSSSSTAATDHALQVLVNGQAVGQTQWSGGGKMMQLTFSLPPDVVKNGANSIDLVTPALPDVTGQVCFVNSIQISYTKTLDSAQPSTITNSGGQTQLYELSHLPSASVWVADIRFPDRANLIPYESLAQGDGTYKIRFQAASGGMGQFLVTPAGMENVPVSVSKRNVAAIRGTPKFLAVGPVQFTPGTQPLLTLHSKQGIRCSYVDQEAIFDYYGYGRYGPGPIQAAVRAVNPAYLMLVGRTTYDYLNYSGENVDPLCPAFLVSTSFWAQTTSDSLFGDLGRGYPEVAVGRLPVNNTADLAGAVRHILNHPGFPMSGIRVHATADTADPQAGDFPAQAEALIAAHPEMAWQRNYLGITAAAPLDATASMLAAANGGADMLLYVGHGNAVSLGNASPKILDTTAVQLWTGNVVMLQGTCTAHWMAKDVQDYRSIAIQALTQPQGGISASVGTSTYMNSDVTAAFMDQLMKRIDVQGMTWGTALMQTQKWALQQPGNAFYGDMGRTEQLFGDPAMPVFAPGKLSPTVTQPAGTSSSGASSGTNSAGGQTLSGQF